MTAMDLYKSISIECDLGKEDPALATMNQWARNKEWYFGIRFYWTNDQGELRPGKNGITVQAGYAIKLIEGLINAYNLATGNEYVLAQAHQIKEGTLDGDDDTSLE